MFHKILVALDHSDISRPVFDQALALAKSANADLMLLHVLSHSDQGCPNLAVFSNVAALEAELQQEMMRRYAQQWEKFEQQEAQILRWFINEAAEAGVRADFTQSFGSPGSVICSTARTWGADVIVMGRHGRAGLKGLMQGSVSNYVFHHAPCSVLVLHEVAPLHAPSPLPYQTTAV